MARSSRYQQLSLADVRRQEAPRPDWRWPDADRVPHNEDGARVRDRLVADLAVAAQALLVTPLADLSELIELLSCWSPDRPTLRLVLGHAPRRDRGSTFHVLPRKAGRELSEACKKHGLSMLGAPAVCKVLSLLRSGALDVRLHDEPGRAMDARILVTDVAVVLGSSAVTLGGLARDLHGNLRVLPDEEARFGEIHQLAEGIWTRASDWKTEFAELLSSLLQLCSWERALARACALVLEGEWARDRVDLPRDPPLWPHQEVALSRGLYLLDNAGGLLVADATGSGKTRLGAWLVYAAWDRQRRRTGSKTRSPIIIAPPGVREHWEDRIREHQGPRYVHSRGNLSAKDSDRREQIVADIEGSMLLVVDEAHNYVNRSRRSMAVLRNLADAVVLFTATPISRGLSDLLAMVALIGADNLADEHIELVERYMTRRRGGLDDMAEEELEPVRKALQSFMLRRTRAHLREYVRRFPERYLSSKGRQLDYPEHRSHYYDLPLSRKDEAVIAEIREEADQLTGLAWLGDTLQLHWAWQRLGIDEEGALKRILSSARALARYYVFETLRSSRYALVEHVEGTGAALKFTEIEGVSVPKAHGKGIVHKLATLSLPSWNFPEELRASASPWLIDRDAHRAEREEESRRYKRIAELARRVSNARERAKASLLAELYQKHHLLLAFDSHLVSLTVLNAWLGARGVSCHLLTGGGGERQKAKAEKLFGLGSEAACVGLCTDAFSEGLNLQQASCVVHLNTPTVIRAAVQRAGRVDRLDTPHREIDVRWPREPAVLASRKQDRLWARVQEEHRLIGSDIERPDSDEIDDPETIAQEVDQQLGDPDALSDAFQLVERMVRGQEALVHNDLYEEMRDRQDRVRALLSLLPTDTRQWAFFVLSGDEGAAPLWVLFDGPESQPVTDLTDICIWLRQELRPGVQATDRPTSTNILEHFVARLAASERLLLSRRRQRAITLLEETIERQLDAARYRMRLEEAQVLTRLLDQLRLSGAEEHVDLRELADRWLHLLRPRWTRLLEERSRRLLPRLKHLAPGLKDEPPTLDELTKLFEGLPTLPPVDERILVAIIAEGG